MREDESIAAIPFATDWKITSNITEEELEQLLADLYDKYHAWDLELTKQIPQRRYETRREFLAYRTPIEKLQQQVHEIQLTLWHRRAAMRSKKYTAKDTANTVMLLLLLKSQPDRCPKEREYLRF